MQVQTENNLSDDFEIILPFLDVVTMAILACTSKAMNGLVTKRWAEWIEFVDEEQNISGIGLFFKISQLIKPKLMHVPACYRSDHRKWFFCNIIEWEEAHAKDVDQHYSYTVGEGKIELKYLDYLDYCTDTYHFDHFHVNPPHFAQAVFALAQSYLAAPATFVEFQQISISQISAWLGDPSSKKVLQQYDIPLCHGYSEETPFENT